MNFKKLLLTAAAAAVVLSAGATTASAARIVIGPHGGVSLHVGDHRGVHDRYWREEYRDRHYIDRDHVFLSLRSNHYDNFDGDPFWRDGRYVVWAHRHHHRVMVEVNPYTGGFIGEGRF
jgi:hypothetical protein